MLFHDHLRVVVGAKSPWAQRRRITLAELVDEPWCVAPSSIGSLVTSAFPASGLPRPRIAVTTTTTHLLFQLLESGRFVGHFGENLLHFYASRFALKKLPIELPLAPFAVAIVTVKNRTISPVAQIFIDAAREVAKPFVQEIAGPGKPAGRRRSFRGADRAAAHAPRAGGPGGAGLKSARRQPSCRVRVNRILFATAAQTPQLTVAAGAGPCRAPAIAKTSRADLAQYPRDTTQLIDQYACGIRGGGDRGTSAH